MLVEDAVKLTAPTHSRTRPPRITAHALHRWIERVDPNATTGQARQAIVDFLGHCRVRPTPRHWTDTKAAPGLRFVYCASRPEVCALLVDDAVVTVLTRNLCRTGRAARSGAAVRTGACERWP